MNLGINLNSLLDKNYQFWYDLSSSVPGIDDRIACYHMLIENGVDCSYLAGRIYFKNEDDLNILKMVM